MRIVEPSFYHMNPAKVARELLGKLLIRRLGDTILGGMIVETEAYYGEWDPASWASRGESRVKSIMYGEPGRTLIRMVHGHWLLNIVTLPPGTPSAVLIRALEPIYGIDRMVINRGGVAIDRLTSGPGRLTEALGIDKELNSLPVYDPDSPIQILHYRNIPEEMVGRSGRIGVKKDLEIPLRFYVKGNPYVSKTRKRG